jgi:hypothetical protein
VVKWGLAIEIAGEKSSWTRETTRVWVADHDDWSAKMQERVAKDLLR